MADIKIMRAWAAHLDSLPYGRSYRSYYLKYVANLSRRGVPIIFEVSHLAKLLGRTPEFINKINHNAEKFYLEFYIPKKRGGARRIDAPYPSLLECQDWILEHILLRISVHEAAHGFVKEKSIITNATAHLGKKSLLKMDVCDFFPSLKWSAVLRIFSWLGYAPSVSIALTNLCCLNGSLSQGASTSPILSNILFYHIDVALNEMAKNSGLTYTRYADDLAFSGENITEEISNSVTAILQKYGLSTNQQKTLIIKGRGRKIVTGISISDNQIKLPREYKRKLRQEAFLYISKPNAGHSDIMYPERLMGKLNYWHQVEPENNFVRWAIAKIRRKQTS